MANHEVGIKNQNKISERIPNSLYSDHQDWNGLMLPPRPPQAEITVTVLTESVYVKAERVPSEVFPGFGISILVKYDFETSLGNLLLIKSTDFRTRLSLS